MKPPSPFEEKVYASGSGESLNEGQIDITTLTNQELYEYIVQTLEELEKSGTNLDTAEITRFGYEIDRREVSGDSALAMLDSYLKQLWLKVQLRSKVDESQIYEQGVEYPPLSIEESLEVLLEEVKRRRMELIELLLSSQDPEYYETLIDGLANELPKELRDKIWYELDYSLPQDTVNQLLDYYEKRIPEDGGYGYGGFLPWFLSTRSRYAEEKREGVSTQVLKWIRFRVQQQEPINPSMQEKLATWSQNIHMADMGTLLSTLNADKVNPGIINHMVHHEIAAGLSFSDGKGYSSQHFQERALDPKSSFEEISSAITALSFFYRHGSNIGYEESGDYAYRALQEIYSERDEYFVRALIDSTIKLPLEGESIDYKRLVLEREGWLRPGQVEDAQVEKLFVEFIVENKEYCTWSERQGAGSVISRELGRVYGFGTYEEEGEGWANRPNEKRRKLENSFYTDINDRYGALYVGDDRFRVFKKDLEFEEKVSTWKDELGTIDRSNTNYYIVAILSQIEDESYADMLPNLYAINLLNKVDQEEMLRELGEVPKELYQEGLLGYGERVKYVEKHTADLQDIMKKLESGGAEKLVAMLENKLAGMEQVAAKEYFGYKDLDPDMLDFYLSFFDIHPMRANPPHHTFFYYAYMRNILPDELVQEFERRTGIAFSPEIENLRSYDEYLKVQPNVLFAEFSSVSQEDLGWLRDQLVELANKIKVKLPTLEYVTVQEMLVDSGVREDRLTEQFVVNYVSFLDIKVRSRLEKHIGISISDLDVPVQVVLLDYLSRVPELTVDEMGKFVSIYGVDGMRTFLALERGDKTLGDKIVKFGQHEKLARPVFRYYSKLLDQAEHSEQLVRKFTNCKEEQCLDLSFQVRKNILGLAQKTIENAVLAEEPGEVEEQIRGCVAKAKAYVAILEEMCKNNVEEVLALDLKDEDKDQMREMLNNNFLRAYPGPEYEEFRVAIASSLESHFDDPATTFQILRDFGKIIGFNRFDIITDDSGREITYCGSFNADPAYGGIGNIMLNETIKKRLADGRPMQGHCDPKQPIAMNYMEDGFMATDFYEVAGHPSFEIWRSVDSSNQVESKKMSKDALIKLVGAEGGIVVREQETEDSYPELQNNMALTRYFTKDGKTYLVFESLPEELLGKFTISKK
jgi:hypothetical protein